MMSTRILSCRFSQRVRSCPIQPLVVQSVHTVYDPLLLEIRVVSACELPSTRATKTWGDKNLRQLAVARWCVLIFQYENTSSCFAIQASRSLCLILRSVSFSAWSSFWQRTSIVYVSLSCFSILFLAYEREKKVEWWTLSHTLRKLKRMHLNRFLTEPPFLLSYSFSQHGSRNIEARSRRYYDGTRATHQVCYILKYLGQPQVSWLSSVVFFEPQFLQQRDILHYPKMRSIRLILFSNDTSDGQELCMLR